jgi:hypothetical protein
MKSIINNQSLGVVVGVDFLRWYVGIAYEEPTYDIRMFVIHRP